MSNTQKGVSSDFQIPVSFFKDGAYFFAQFKNYPEGAELSKCSCYSKRKLGGTTHFSEIIKLRFDKKCHTLVWILALLE